MDERAADLRWMGLALAQARRALGTTAPNPAVGCVIVRGGQLLGVGRTAPGGRPHAETEALADGLRRAGPDALRGATAYVTLEPCSHHGKTGPCAEALIAAGIGACVVAIADPDSRVGGRGLERLREAGIVIRLGVLAEAAASLNAGFLKRVATGLPLVTLKLAVSLDGRIAAASGHSRWITGELARARGHLLRAEHEAILIGSGTALADDPALTCRIPGLAHRSPVRVVLDGRLRLPPLSRLLAEGNIVAEGVSLLALHPPVLVVTTASMARHRKAEALAAAGAQIIAVAPIAVGRMSPDPAAALTALAERGLNRVLVEGGGEVAASMLARGLVDRLALFRAGRMIGSDGLPGVGALALERVDAGPRFSLVERIPCGEDWAETWERASG